MIDRSVDVFNGTEEPEAAAADKEATDHRPVSFTAFLRLLQQPLPLGKDFPRGIRVKKCLAIFQAVFGIERGSLRRTRQVEKGVTVRPKTGFIPAPCPPLLPGVGKIY